MGCAASSACVVESIAPGADWRAAAQSEAGARRLFGLGGLRCSIAARPVGRDGDLRLSIGGLPAAACRDVWTRVEAACTGRDFAVLDTELSVEGGRASLSFDVAPSYGEVLKHYDVQAHAKLEPTWAASPGAGDERPLHLSMQGLRRVMLLPAVMDIVEEFGYELVRAKASASCRAPDAAISWSFWVQARGDAGQGGACQSNPGKMVAALRELVQANHPCDLDLNQHRLLDPIGEKKTYADDCDSTSTASSVGGA